MITKSKPLTTHASPLPIKPSCLELTWVCSDLPSASVILFLRHIRAWLPSPSSLNLADEVRRLTQEMHDLFLIILINIGRISFAFGKTVPLYSHLFQIFLEKKVTVGASEMEEKAIENIAYTVYGGEPLELTWNQLRMQFSIQSIQVSAFTDMSQYMLGSRLGLPFHLASLEYPVYDIGTGSHGTIPSDTH